MPKPKYTQRSMFSQGEDLPLFTGAAPQAQITPYHKEATPRPEPLPFRCRFCRDTGKLGDYAFCSCQAGVEARKLRIKETLIQDVRGLSSGTLANLTGYTRYSDLERIQNAFVEWCAGFHADYPGGFDTWQQAWHAFWPTMKAVLARETS